MSVPAHSKYEASSSSSWSMDNSPSVASPLQSRSLEVFEAISHTWRQMSLAYSPYSTMQALRSNPLKVADFVPELPIVWTCLCVAYGRYSQGLPYAVSISILTAFFYSLALSSPARGFLASTSPFVLSLWTTFIALPSSIFLQPAILSHLLLSFALWYLGPTGALPHYASVAGYTNLVGCSLLIACSPPVDPITSQLTNMGAYTGLNAGVQLFILSIYFPQHKSIGIPYCIVCGYAALRDPFGFVLGIMAAVNSCLYFSPKASISRRTGVSGSSSPASSSLLDSSLGYSEEQNFWAFPDVPPAPGGLAFLDRQSPIRERVLSTFRLRSVAPRPSMGAIPSVMVTQASTSDSPGTQQTAEGRQDSPQPQRTPSITEEFSGVASEQSEEASSVRRRRSVAGPRAPNHQRHRHSLDLSTQNRPLPMPPASSSRRPLQVSASNIVRDSTKPSARPPRADRPRRPHSHLSEETIHLTQVIASASDAQDAVWDDRFFQVLHRLGESSSRSTYEVKDQRTGTVFVRKTYYPRQTNCNHIKLALSTLISSQEQPEASPHVLRCHGAYISQGAVLGVRAIFEYCEGGSLQSISKVITQRGGVVGEKVAARLAEGMLQGLHYLSNLNMVHFNIQPSNVFVSRSGIVKLSEPEIPGEGAVALTDRFANSVRYASPERIRGKPSNLSKSDVWAMGIALLEFVQNRYPYSEDLETVQLMVRIVEGQPPVLQDRTDVTWSSRMKEFFRQILAADELLRPIAWEMLSHPWIAATRQQNISMEKWIAEVRGWPLRR